MLCCAVLWKERQGKGTHSHCMSADQHQWQHSDSSTNSGSIIDDIVSVPEAVAVIFAVSKNETINQSNQA